MKSTSLLSRRPETHSAQISDDAWLVLDLDSEAGVPLRFEGTASAIWNQLAEPLEFGLLCHRIAGLYHSAEAEIRPDVERFVLRLVAARLVQVDDQI